MKKISLLYISLALLCGACNDMLDEEPEYSVNGKTVFKDESTVKMALNSCYGFMSSTNLYGQFQTEFGESGSGIGWIQVTAGEDISGLNIFSNNVYSSGIWSGHYKVISECNWFLENMKGTSLDPAFSKYMIAQIHFLRGFSYFQLLQYFGGVPLRIEPTTSNTLAMARASREDVIAQIEKDWLIALEPRGLKEAESDPSTPTIHTVNAYMAKLFYVEASRTNKEEYWKNAKTYGDKVMGKYILESKFADLFEKVKINSKEVIFQLNYSMSTAYTFNRLSWVFAPGSGQSWGSTPGISWGRSRPSRSFYDLFKGTYLGDPRFNATFLTAWKNQKGNTDSAWVYPVAAKTKKVNGKQVISERYEINYATLADPTNPRIDEIPDYLDSVFIINKGNVNGWPHYKKMVDFKADAQKSNYNLALFRYADFLLMMADIENELNNTGTAVGYVNDVLKRARTSVTPEAAQPADWSKSLSKETVRDKIFFERLFELAGEGHAFLEARRRGVEYLKKVVQINNKHHITQAFYENMVKLGVTDGWRDRKLAEDDATLSRSLLLPIPFDEINGNDLITNNDQNPGYN